MTYYAQIDLESNICYAVSQLSDIVEQENLIKIEEYDLSLLGKKWNGSGWEEVKVEENNP